MKRLLALILVILMVASFTACAAKNEQSANLVEELGLTSKTKGATEQTTKVNSAMYDLLDFEDKTEFQCATKGLIDAPATLEIKDADVTITCHKNALLYLLSQDTVNIEKSMQIEGDKELLLEFSQNLNQGSASEAEDFNIIEP